MNQFIRRLYPLFFLGLWLCVSNFAMAETDGMMLMAVEQSSTKDGGRHLLMVGWDARTGREYGSILTVHGKTWVTSQVMEIRRPLSLDGGAHGFEVVGAASQEIADRFNKALENDLKRYNRDSPINSPIRNSRPESTNSKSGQSNNSSTPTNGSPSSNRLPTSSAIPGLAMPLPVPEAPSEPISNQIRASQLADNIGRTLNEINWSLQEQAAQQAAQRATVLMQQEQMRLELTQRLSQYDNRDAAIKADMLLNLQQYLESSKKNISTPSLSRQPITEIYLTEEGQQKLLERAKAQKHSGDWVGLAQTLTYLANPWSGIAGDSRLQDLADTFGIMKGPVLKENSVEMAGIDNELKFRVLQAANLLQAACIMDRLWLDSEHLGNTVAAAAIAIKGSAVLEKWGVKDDALKLIETAEALVAYLHGFETGFKLELVNTVDGSVQLVAGTGRLVSVALEDPDAAVTMVKGIYHAITDNIGPVLNEAYGEAVRVMRYGTAEERGELTGHIGFMIVSEVLTAGAAEAAKSGLIAIKATKMSQRSVQAARELLKPIEKVVEKSRALVSRVPEASPYVRKLERLEELAARDPKTWMGYFKSFEGDIIPGPVELGDILFQSQRAGQVEPGQFFASVRALDRSHAEEMSNIAKYDNHTDKLKVFVVKKRASAYAGKVADGTGHQLFFPRELYSAQDLLDILEEVDEIHLPFKVKE